MDIKWYGHDSIRIGNLFIDPFKISTNDKAEIILITHSHFDHCSVEDIRKLFKPDTIIVCPPDCISKLKGMEVRNLHIVRPGDSLVLPSYKVDIVAAYNKNKDFHPKQNEWVGYIVTFNDVKYYHAGDTDVIPEMSNVKCDYAFLPVSGVYTMTAVEAVKAVEMIKPKVAIPIHYGSLVGKEENAIEFKELASKYCQVIILNKK